MFNFPGGTILLVLVIPRSRYFALSKALAILTALLRSLPLGLRFSTNLEAVCASPGPELFENT
jgi:hypothetical protein